MTSVHAAVSVTRWVIGAILLIVIVAAPIPYASNREFAWAPLAVIVGALVMAEALCVAANKKYRYRTSTSLVLAASAMLLVVIWAALQTTTWLASGTGDAFVVLLPGVLGRHVPSLLSIDSEGTVQGIVRLATYSAVFLMAADLGRSARYAKAMTITVIGAALLVTAYGWIMHVTVRSCIAVLFVKRPIEPSGSCAFSGTFINSGNFATYAAIAGLVCIAQLHWLALKSHVPQAAARERWRLRLMAMGLEGSIYLAALVILVGGMVLSASRAGLLSFALAAVLMTAATSVAQGKHVGHVLMWMGAIVVLTFGAVLAADGIVLIRYLDLLDRGDPNRINLYEMVIRQISERPLTGWGLGSFPALYSIFQADALSLYFDKAHNVYLENASDLGIPGALLLTLAVLALALRCLRGLRERSRDLPYPSAAVGATLLVGIHSLVDFGIQMPAVAITFAALLGVGWAQSWSSRRSSSG